MAVVPFIILSAATAQTDRDDIDSAGLVIEANAGWDGTIDRTMPMPISFLIRNDSDRIIEGHLTLSEPMNGRQVTLGEVVVGPGTSRRFTSIQDMSEWYQCYATLAHGRDVLWRRELALTTGQVFDPNVNFVLFIDDSGRRLQLPGGVSDSAAIAAAELVVAGEQSRPVQSLTVKTWQVPDHPGPLIIAQAMVFPERAAERDLNLAQWRAVAEWMCQGGVIFVHDASLEIIDRLIEAAPLVGGPAPPSGAFRVRSFGLGAIHEYSQPLFAMEGDEIRRLIAERTANVNKHHICALVDSGNQYQQRGGRADLHRVFVVAFFGIYTLLAGVVSLFLFRLSQRRIAAYTVFVVVGASVLSGLLGGFLRLSQGDLRWMTVTQAGAGGLVQVGSIEVQSAGGRNTQVAVNGEHADLQFTGRTERYYNWNQQQMGYPPFTWQPNLLTSEPGTYQVNVPMTPWGRRRLFATAFRRESGRLDFELDFEPQAPTASQAANGEEQPESLGNRSGIFTLNVVNGLPFDIKECWLVIGVTHRSSGQAVSNQSNPYATQPYQAGPGGATASSTDGLIDVYHMQQLAILPAAGVHEESFPANFRVIEYNWDLARSWRNGSMTPPRISHLGGASAWLIGRIDDSPILTIDQRHSDFVPREHLHLYVQEIRPEEMPDASLFFSAEEATEPGEPGT